MHNDAVNPCTVHGYLEYYLGSGQQHRLTHFVFLGVALADRQAGLTMARGKGTFNLCTFLQQAGQKHFQVQTLFGVNCIGILVWLLQPEINHVSRAHFKHATNERLLI